MGMNVHMLHSHLSFVPTVSYWVVPLWVCRYHRTSQGKVVLSTVHYQYEEERKQEISYLALSQSLDIGFRTCNNVQWRNVQWRKYIVIVYGITTPPSKVRLLGAYSCGCCSKHVSGRRTASWSGRHRRWTGKRHEWTGNWLVERNSRRGGL